MKKEILTEKLTNPKAKTDNKKKTKPIDDATLGRYSTKKEPKKSLSVYLNNQNKLLMSSIAIADRKAAVLIRINTALISGLIIFQSYFADHVALSHIMAPILVVGMSCSLLFAILVIKPFSRILYKLLKNDIKSRYPELKFNNFMLLEKVSLEEYEASMQKVVNSQNLQIGNLVRFNYVMSASIANRFMLLEVAYTIFMLTFGIIALIYLASLFLV